VSLFEKFYDVRLVLVERGATLLDTSGWVVSGLGTRSGWLCCTNSWLVCSGRQYAVQQACISRNIVEP
jgi:hypothetical protein